jgi:pimeloyl-ACP methyl ester carboxylesterase
MGCKTIREAYRQCEAQVAGMVFIDGSLYVGRRDVVRNAARTALERNGVEGFLKNLVEGMFSAITDSAAADFVRARARRMDVGFAGDLFLDSVDWDMAEAVQTLREINVPTLVVQCTAFDTSFGWRALREGEETPFMTLVRTLTPKPQIVALSDSGHFPMLDAPDQLGEVLEAFAAGLD